MQFSPLSEKRRKEIASLARKKGRVVHHQMLIEGWRSVESAFLSGAPLREVLVTSGAQREEPLLDDMQSAGINLYEISDRIAAKISAVEASQGILAVADIMPYDMGSLIEKRFIIALDCVQDPGNVGTIIRAAAWFGMEGIIGGLGTADFYHPKVVRATMGGIWSVPLVQSRDLESDISSMKKSGFGVVVADLSGKDVNEWMPTRKQVLIIGSEAHGVSEELLALSDEKVLITGNADAVESLNAGMAAGILMHHWANTSGN